MPLTVGDFAFADLNGDGNLDIVLSNSNKVRAYNSAGQQMWLFPAPDNVAITPSPTIADLDGDGHLEIVQLSGSGKVYVLNGSTGTLIWSFSASNTGSKIFFGTAAVADLNHDGKLEVIASAFETSGAGFGNGNLYCLNHAGQLLWNLTMPGNTGTYSPVIGDLDHNGEFEIVLGLTTNPDGLSGKIIVVNAVGQIVAQSAATQPIRYVMLADLDGNHALEICYAKTSSNYGQKPSPAGFNCLNYDLSQFHPVAGYSIDDKAPWIKRNHDFRNTNLYTFPNHAPHIDPIVDQRVAAGQMLRFPVNASDPDGDAIHLTASNLPSNASFIESGGDGTFTWIPKLSQVGVYNVVFDANDGSLTAHETVIITVGKPLIIKQPSLSASTSPPNG